MNGRAYPAAATAVDRSSGPVLAWNVEPTQFPSGTYPEMPPAAAAAVSPVVPAAATAPPDPYGRCWQSQVDPSACFPYFGTLYGSSLPPPSYRMQPGCLSNLGQFWPPTPPPEGCVRYDGTNNLHYCSPLTPVFRHGESLPQNMLGVHQRLGHYSHLIDMNKDSGLKRLDSCMDGMQRQKVLLNSKHAKEVQPRSCSCYECNETFSRGTTQSVNKENISGSKFVEAKNSDDKQKLKSCKRVKDEGYSHQRSSAYHQNGSAINNYSCSVEQNVARMATSIQGPNPSDFAVQNSQKLVSTGNCVRQEFLRPQSNSFPVSRCASNPLMNVVKDVNQEMHSMPKTSDNTRHDIPAEKVSRHKVHVSSGYEPCPCPSVQTPSSSSSYRSAEKSCFSPPYMSSRTLYNSYPETSTHSKTPNMLMIYSNGYNASPLKNVYFSYYESENFDMGSGVSSRKNKDNNYCKQEKVSNMGSFDNHVATPSSSQGSIVLPPASNVGTLLNGNSVHHMSHYNSSTVPSDAYGCVYQSSCLEQQKVSDSKYLSSTTSNHNEMVTACKPLTKIGSVQVKQEKVANTDCKFQKSHHTTNSSRTSQPSDTIAAHGVLNLSTSLRCPKIEPEDPVNTLSSDMRTSTSLPQLCSMANGAPCISSTTPSQHHSQILKPENTNVTFYSGVPSPGHLMNYPKVPNPTTPQMHELENDCSAAVPEDLCPMPQMAPSGGAELPGLSKMPTTGHEAPIEMGCQLNDPKDCPKITCGREVEESISASLGVLPSVECHLQDHSSPYEKVCSARNPKSLFKDPHSEEMVACNSSEDPVYGRNDLQSEACQNVCKDEKSTLLMKVEAECATGATEDFSEDLDYNASCAFTPTKSEIPDSVSCPVKIECVEENAVKSIKICKEEIAEDSATEDCHGLYILLQGIAHKRNSDYPPDIQSSVNQDSDQESRSSSVPVEVAADAISSKMKGLSLLCALAEEQFFMEFGTDASLKSGLRADEKVAANIISNYPAVKEEEEELTASQLVEDMDKKSNILEIDAELKMRQRLAELQQKYREKQKELARLKPRKIKSPCLSDIPPLESNLIATSPACQILNCSKETSDIDDDKMPSLKPQSNQVDDCDSIEKQVKSSKSSSKSSSDENCPSDNASPSLAKPPIVDQDEKRLRKNRSVSKCILRHNATRRRVEMSRALRVTTSSSRNRLGSRRKACNTSGTPVLQSESDASDGTKAIAKHQKKLSKHKPSSSEKKDDECNIAISNSSEDADIQTAQFSMRSPKKRKPENPKRFMPAKQVRLTETIIAKQLRNRILFESPGCAAKSADEKRYDVPEELFDALRKCNLGDTQAQDVQQTSASPRQLLEVVEDKNVLLKEGSDVVVKVLRMTVEYLLENQRILALEEGLFYAGTIKEVQSSDVYSIVLDGQRGNKRHLFSKEEMLNQTIIETKPTSLDELPEGTRICAYWSHQYRCLYPGTVVRAPAPSPDWSEPRVYVEFDDGDSAQIAMKNIRFLPADMQLSEEDDKDNMSESKTGLSGVGRGNSSSRKRKSATKEMKRHSKLCKKDFTQMNTSGSNDSNVEECGLSAIASPSHRLDQDPSQDKTLHSDSTKVSRRTRRQLSKKRSSSKGKVKEAGSSPEKSKKHKRYKDRHKHHHHHRHHHRHHRHCHHHRHCKKRKHHKRASNVDNIINVVIPSSSIPFSNLIAKSTRSSMKDAEAQCVGHSKKESKQLPQPGSEPGDSKTVSTGTAKEDKATLRKEGR